MENGLDPRKPAAITNGDHIGSGDRNAIPNGVHTHPVQETESVIIVNDSKAEKTFKRTRRGFFQWKSKKIQGINQLTTNRSTDYAKRDIFVSYCRRNKEYVVALVNGLKQRGFSVWIDWEDIPPASVWRDEIRYGITGAGFFLCVISPEWCNSRECLIEYEEALRLNKPMLPIIHRDCPDLIPAFLNSINWIMGRELSAVGECAEAVKAAVAQEASNMRMMADLLAKATAWNDGGRTLQLLLTHVEFVKFEKALYASEPQQAPTPLVREYLRASRRHLDARARRQRTWMIAALIVSILLTTGAIAGAIVAAHFAQVAQQEREIAVEQQHKAEYQKQLTQASAFGALSQRFFDNAANLAILYAVQAVQDVSPLSTDIKVLAYGWLHRNVARIGGASIHVHNASVVKVLTSQTGATALSLDVTGVAFMWRFTPDTALAELSLNLRNAVIPYRNMSSVLATFALNDFLPDQFLFPTDTELVPLDVAAAAGNDTLVYLAVRVVPLKRTSEIVALFSLPTSASASPVLLANANYSDSDLTSMFPLTRFTFVAAASDGWYLALVDAAGYGAWLLPSDPSALDASSLFNSSFATSYVPLPQKAPLGIWPCTRGSSPVAALLVADNLDVAALVVWSLDSGARTVFGLADIVNSTMRPPGLTLDGYGISINTQCDLLAIYITDDLYVYSLNYSSTIATLVYYASLPSISYVSVTDDLTDPAFAVAYSGRVSRFTVSRDTASASFVSDMVGPASDRQSVAQFHIVRYPNATDMIASNGRQLFRWQLSNESQIISGVFVPRFLRRFSDLTSEISTQVPDMLVAASFDNTLGLWPTQSPAYTSQDLTLFRLVVDDATKVTSVRFANPHWLVVARQNSDVHVYDTRTFSSTPAAVLSPPCTTSIFPYPHLVVSPTHNAFAWVCRGVGSISVVPVPTGEAASATWTVYSLPTTVAGYLGNLAFSPDGAWLAIRCTTGTFCIALWPLNDTTGVPLSTTSPTYRLNMTSTLHTIKTGSVRTGVTLVAGCDTSGVVRVWAVSSTSAVLVAQSSVSVLVYQSFYDVEMSFSTNWLAIPNSYDIMFFSVPLMAALYDAAATASPLTTPSYTYSYSEIVSALKWTPDGRFLLIHCYYDASFLLITATTEACSAAPCSSPVSGTPTRLTSTQSLWRLDDFASISPDSAMLALRALDITGLRMYILDTDSEAAQLIMYLDQRSITHKGTGSFLSQALDLYASDSIIFVSFSPHHLGTYAFYSETDLSVFVRRFDVNSLARKACAVVGRDLTDDEFNDVTTSARAAVTCPIPSAYQITWPSP